jgi:carbon starvation protein
MKRQRYAWVTIVPATWLVVCTLTAGLEKILSPDTSVGFISHARKFSDALAAGKILAPAKSLVEMSRIIFNDYVDATLAALFVAVVVSMVVYGFINIRRALNTPKATAVEVEFAGAVVGASNA